MDSVDSVDVVDKVDLKDIVDDGELKTAKLDWNQI
jgi:hypothetical protein